MVYYVTDIVKPLYEMNSKGRRPTDSQDMIREDQTCVVVASYPDVYD